MDGRLVTCPTPLRKDIDYLIKATCWIFVVGRRHFNLEIARCNLGDAVEAHRKFGHKTKTVERIPGNLQCGPYAT